MERANNAIRRCAVYTRKSSEEAVGFLFHLRNFNISTESSASSRRNSSAM